LLIVVHLIGHSNPQQLYDAIRPGIVNWKRVVRQFRKLQSMMDQIQNCNYAIELGKQLRFSLVGIQGKDIYDANPTLTLGLSRLMPSQHPQMPTNIWFSPGLATDARLHAHHLGPVHPKWGEHGHGQG